MARKEPRITASLTQENEIRLDDFRQIYDSEFHEINAEGSLSEFEFNGCLFEKVKFSQIDFDHCALIDCVFDHCDFSNADLSNSCFRRVEFRQCNLVGIDASRSVMEDVLMTRCNARYSNFSGTQMKNCEWKDTRADEAYLNDCRLMNLSIENCVFSGAEFLHTPLKQIDFSTSMIDGIALSGPELKGIIVSSIQAVSLAKMLGIVIKE